MTYATRPDLELEFGAAELAQLTDRVDGLVIDDAVLAHALEAADAEINVYLAAQYALPLAATTPLLVRLACDIARYRLYDAAAPEQVRTRYEDARSVLRDIAKGVGSLGLDDSSELVAPSGSVRVIAPARDFDDDVLGAY
jgi:phage gp36-like protein